MTGRRTLGVLGGTFNPVHFGHLDAAQAARQALALHDVLLVPSHDPPHRAGERVVSPWHRFALVALAIAELDGVEVSDIEMRRSGPSYTYDTLGRLAERGWTPSQLFFIIGSDAFAEIAKWYAYPAVLERANFAVVARPGLSLDEALPADPAVRHRVRPTHQPPRSDDDTGVYLVPARTRDVSSTNIRTRLALGQPIDDLVPLPVQRHIRTHQLYERVDDLHGEDESRQGGR